MDQKPHGRTDAFALAFALLFPTALTWVYFVVLGQNSPALQQGAYGLGKTIQFLFPVAWGWWTGRLTFRRPVGSTRGVLLGMLFGLAIAAAMLMLYHGVLKGSEFFAGPTQAIRAKTAGIGIQSTVAFVALGAFYSLVHSWLEEYYWRWFVFGLLRRNDLLPNIGMTDEISRHQVSEKSAQRFSLPTALVVSSLGFMAHHVILLATFFGWSSPATYVFSLAVAVGGIAWGWLYERTGSLYGPWISHLLVDAAIFVVGYAILQA